MRVLLKMNHKTVEMELDNKINLMICISKLMLMQTNKLTNLRMLNPILLNQKSHLKKKIMMHLI